MKYKNKKLNISKNIQQIFLLLFLTSFFFLFLQTTVFADPFLDIGGSTYCRSVRVIYPDSTVIVTDYPKENISQETINYFEERRDK